MIIGGLLLMAALLLSIYNLYNEKNAQQSVETVSETLITEIEKNKTEELDSENSLPDYVLYPEVEMPLIEIDGEQYIGFLEIPALNLSLPVLGGEWKEERLKKAPGLYEGSVYQDNMIIAGHNYRSHFSGLKKLEEGTEIYFIDGNGTVFSYELAWVEVIDEMDVEQMSAQTEGWDLTLFTCTYGGRERYTLRCVRQ